MLVTIPEKTQSKADLYDVVRGELCPDGVWQFSPAGRILILQDRFSERLIRRAGRRLSQPCQAGELTQSVYPKTDNRRVYTYSYRYCFFAPRDACFVRAAVPA